MSVISLSSSYALVGPGAIGLYYGGILAKAGASLRVLARSDASVMSERGVVVRMIDPQTEVLNAEYQIQPAQVAESAEAIGYVDVVIIAAKTTVNAQLIESLRLLIKPKQTVVLTLQNGMGNAEYFAKHFPENPMLAGLCFVCANRTSPAVVENYLPGRVEIGSLNGQWPEWEAAMVDVFVKADIRCKASVSLDASLWRKLCWNVPFNGLSIAGGGITTDRILADPQMAQRARTLMDELVSAAALAGYAISEEYVQGQFDVTEKMGAYQPSSLIDYLAGRAVEVESIWGEPLRRGQALGADMPELAALYAEIKALVDES
ncbi:MAG: ketopantoate reductase family protein [Opitutaceae bacterium]